MWPFSKTVPDPVVVPAVDTTVTTWVVDTTKKDIADLQDSVVRLRENLQWAMDNVTHLLAKVSALESKPEPYDFGSEIQELKSTDMAHSLHFVDTEKHMGNMQEAMNTVATALEELRQQTHQACEHADAAKRQSEEALVKASQKSGGSGGIGSIA